MKRHHRLVVLCVGTLSISIWPAVVRAGYVNGVANFAIPSNDAIAKIHEGHGGDTAPFGTPPCHRHKSQLPSFKGYPDCHVHLLEDGKWQIRRRYKSGNKWVNCPDPKPSEPGCDWN